MTIPKNSHRAQQVLDQARAIKCYSLSNNFIGQPLSDRPVIWGEPLPGESRRPLVEVSPIGFLRHELTGHGPKLKDEGAGHFSIYIHSNLWYEFESGTPAVIHAD